MIEKLQMFIALANEQHFGRAAEICGVTQPTLSSAIKQLEGELGVQLVWRGSRFQGLTPEGQRVLGWAQRIVADARNLKAEMRAARKGLSGDLRIGVIPTALPMVADLTAPFLRRHPGMRVAVLSRSSAEILDQMAALKLDAGITYLDNEPLGRVTALPLFDEGYQLLVGADSSWARAARIGWEDVSRMPLCLLSTDMQNRRIIDRHLSAAGARVDAAVESNSVIALVAHVLKGDRASVIPDRTAALFAHDGRLAAVPIEASGPRYRVGLVAPFRQPHTPVIAALLDEARRIGEACAPA